MKVKRVNLKRFVFSIIAIIAIFVVSRVIYAATVEKTPIVCQDENMFNSLKNALSSYILLPGDADKTTLTINIPTESIPQITELDLTDKNISNITGIEKLSYLTKINLGKNKITDISPLAELNYISDLKLNDNNIGNSVSSVLLNKTSITKLNLSSTGLVDISFISSLNALQELEIANGSFNNLNAIINLRHLKKLNISGNQSIRTIQNILYLSELEYLNISNTGIDKLELDPDNKIGIYNLRELKELYVSGIDVESLYPIIQTYTNEHHHIDEYGEWVSEEEALLLKLEVLDISYIKKYEDSYVSIPSFYELNTLKNLKKLYIQGNFLTSVYNIYEMRELQEINLKDNKINDLSGLVYKETETDEYGVNHEVVKDYFRATSIDLSHNEIDDLRIFAYIPNKSNIQYLNLSNNHIHSIEYIEDVGGTLKLQDQTVNFPVYKKKADIDHYILLTSIMQNAKKPGNKLYSENAKYTTSGCVLNTNPNYQTPDLFNVIIDKNKTEEDNMSISLSGGIADGTVINFIITEDAYSGIDSLIFNDSNLTTVIYQELYNLLKDEDDRYLVKGGQILNVNHEVISRVEKLDLFNSNISDITGLGNFDNLKDLNISKNINIRTLEPLKYCSNIEILNASETSVGDNISAIKELKNLKTLILNNIGMTKIDSINNLIKNISDNGEELLLEELDISANLLNNINGIENITSLKKLSVTSNNLTEIPDLSNLLMLNRLTAYSNKITKIPKLSNSSNLKYILLSDNKITDISELGKLGSIIELELNNNLLDDSDLENIKNTRITNTLNLAGNCITDISAIKANISNIRVLDISKNMIKDVSSIDERFSQNGTLTANNQKIAIVLEPTNQENVLVDLPQLFIATKNPNSYFYTNNDFELNNCTLQENKISIKISEIENNIATVKILGGKGVDSVVSIVPPIQTDITYSSSEWTNQNVTATISFKNRENVHINTSDEKNNHVFTENGEFTFEYVDEYGMNGSTKAVVTWIDKEAPQIKGVTNNQTYQNSVKAYITDNHELSSIKIQKDNNQDTDYISGTEITEIGEYTLIAKDSVNNEARIKFTIKAPNAPEDPEDPDDPENPEDPEKIESSNYVVNNEDRIITNIQPETNYENFQSNIVATSEFIVKNKNGNELSEDDKIKTGCIMSTKIGTYKLIVKGDANGDGNADIKDILLANKHRLGKASLKDEYLIAGDVNKDGKVDIRDILQINKYRLNKINLL